jgi:hypothetical protein
MQVSAGRPPTSDGPGDPEGPFFLGYLEAGLEEFQVFDAWGQALSSMETPEVEEGAYRLFDSAGRRARLGTQKWDVTAEEWSAPEPEAMRAAVSSYLVRMGFTPPGAETDIRVFAETAAVILKRLEDLHTPAWIRAIRGFLKRLRN